MRGAGAVGTAAALVLTGCGADDGGDDVLTMWTLERQPERVVVQEQLAAEFTEQTGVPVQVVAIDEPQFNQLLTSAAAADDLPDVIGGVPLAGVELLASNDLIDLNATGRALDGLDEDTFAQHSLDLLRDEGRAVAVPSDAWPNVLVYRRDLFDAAGLAPPTTYEAVLAAAEELDDDAHAGFVGFTTIQEGFEHVALANDCQLVDDAGAITLDSPACVDAMSFYDQLITDYSVPGAQDVQSTRATYLAGDAAMITFSPFLLDELAGLVDSRLPTCEECLEDPGYLARNSGVVTALQGPDASAPSGFGQVVSWALPVGGGTQAADLVQFMMSDGYERWIGFAPEAKVPVRRGTPEAPTRYVDAWEQMPVGVDRRAPLADLYSPEVVELLREAPDTVQMRAVPQGEGQLVGATLGENPVGQAVSDMTGGGLSPERATEQMAQDARRIQGAML